MANTSYLIGTRIDSPDRLRNLNILVNYLLANTDGIIMIKESDKEQKVPSILDPVISNKRVQYYFEESDTVLNRPRLINDLLSLTTTPVACLNDVDVLLSTYAYKEAEGMIMNQGYDVVYPYPECLRGQYQIELSDNVDSKFFETWNIDDLRAREVYQARTGFAVFVNSRSHIRAGGENEEFEMNPHTRPLLQYDDNERYERFKKLQYRISWLEYGKMYHLNHTRSGGGGGFDSFKGTNYQKYKNITEMSQYEFINYMNSQEYIMRRQWYIPQVIPE